MNNDQPVIITSGAGPAPAPLPGPRRGFGIGGILIVMLAICTVILGFAAASASSRASKATTNLSAATAKAAADAKTAQKTADDKAATLANGLPYRNYTAPNAFGGFVISFPKNWSSSVDEEVNGSPQVVLSLNPNFVRRVNNTDDLLATKIQLITTPTSQYMENFTSKSISQSDIKVSGIAGKQLTGKLPDPRMNRLVVIPVRDKTLLFINENPTYSATFDTILAQAKINP